MNRRVGTQSLTMCSLFINLYITHDAALFYGQTSWPVAQITCTFFIIQCREMLFSWRMSIENIKQTSETCAQSKQLSREGTTFLTPDASQRALSAMGSTIPSSTSHNRSLHIFRRDISISGDVNTHSRIYIGARKLD